MISDRPARQFFDLFNELIALNAELNWMEGEIYDPEDLIRQINGKINAIQEANRAKKITVVDEEESKEAKV